MLNRNPENCVQWTFLRENHWLKVDLDGLDVVQSSDVQRFADQLGEGDGGGGEGTGVVVVADPVGVLDRHFGKQIGLILREVEHQVQSETAGRSGTEILKTNKKNNYLINYQGQWGGQLKNICEGEGGAYKMCHQIYSNINKSFHCLNNITFIIG
jgi:hypothetical protein